VPRSANDTAVLAALLTSPGTAVIGVALDGTVTSWSAGATAMYGWLPDEVVGGPIAVIVPPDVRDELHALERRVLDGGQVPPVQTVRLHRDGRRVEVQLHVLALRGPDGSVVGTLRLHHDLTPVRQAQDQARVHRARLEALLRNAQDVVLVVDVRARVTFASPAARREFGYPPAALLGRQVTAFHHPAEAERVRAAWLRVVAAPGATETLLLRLRHADGSWRECEHVLTNLLHEPDVAGIVVNIRDVTVRRAAEEELQRLAMHDGLTGLVNRALLLDRISQAMAWGRRNGTSTGVVVLDVVGMAAVNAAVGEGGGDAVLRAVAARLAESVRGTDSVARIGADDFAVLVEDVASGEELLSRAATCCEAVQGELVVDGVVVQVRVRAGAAVTPAADAGALLQAAERNVGSPSASAGRLQGSAGSPARQGSAAIGELRRAIAGDQLRLHFQPVLSVSDGTFLGAEGLVRWAHPDRGLLPPAAFVPLAESSGLVVELGAWVLGAAVRQASAWHAAGLPYVVGANLSPRQLVGGELVDLVQQLLRDSGLPPERLVLEVTESAVIDDPGAPDVLTALSDLGVRLSLDDFGTGYSSLTYLKRFPVHSIKIDRSFVSGLGRDSDDEAIVASVVSLARAIGKRVVAEGVETAQQAAALRALDVDSAQGFLWSPALPSGSLDSWLAARATQDEGQEEPSDVRLQRAPAPPAVPAGVDDLHRRMLELHGQGASLHTIAAALNAEGSRTAAGPRWTTTSVARAVAALIRR
jgi:diguanylate cyclase (GGDEF)-like protein/PAS domain S-box-containing protein